MVSLLTLPNGVRIVSEPMNSVRSAAVGIWVGAGSRCEKHGEEGSAHFIEHMLFKDTAMSTAAELATPAMLSTALVTSLIPDSMPSAKPSLT